MTQSVSERRGVEILKVDDERSGQRIDNFLMNVVKGVPKSHVYRLLRRGEVRVNKGRVKPGYRLQAGDMVRVPPVRVAAPNEPGRPPDTVLKRLEAAVCYEDDRLLVIDKPSGMAVHGGSGLSFGVIEALRALRPGAELELVHRLDRDTSGCLLISKRRSALRELHALLREGGVDKRYLALARGRPERRFTRVDAPLRKNLLQGGERVVRVDEREGRPAETRFRLRRAFDDCALLEAELLTGRTHQIRVHAAHLGHPLAGDDKYGDPAFSARMRALGLKRLFLHAERLGFHPSWSERPMRIEAPLPDELQVVLDRLTPA